MWHLGPSMRPHELARRLVEHGFEHVGDDSGMALELVHPRPLESPAWLGAEPVQDDLVLARWVETMLEAFELPPTWSDWFEQRCSALGYQAWSHYLGYVDGQPVGTASSFTTDDVVGIYNVGTIPQARRRGIGAALTLQALADARARGARHAVLHASEMGVSIYRQLGFRPICSGGLYRWRPQL
jgi:ribosomal protein S18 acetylase RimI-like enzyme